MNIEVLENQIADSSQTDKQKEDDDRDQDSSVEFFQMATPSFLKKIKSQKKILKNQMGEQVVLLILVTSVSSEVKRISSRAAPTL